MTADVWLTETYFDWLRSEAFSVEKERKEYEGVLRELHDIPFYWTIWSDSNRAGDAQTFRQSDFLGFQEKLEDLDQHWLGNWAMATPSVLEVLLGVARRWHAYFEGDIQMYFGHLFINMCFDRYPGHTLTSAAKSEIRMRCDDWMSRQFASDGRGSPFPVTQNIEQLDCTQIDIWGQMNMYSFEHFQ